MELPGAVETVAADRAGAPRATGRGAGRDLATRAFVGVLLIAFYYLAYRYPLQINSVITSPTYSDTPTVLQVGKFALMLGVVGWYLAVAASTRGRSRAGAGRAWGAGAAMLTLGLFVIGKGVLMGVQDVLAFGFGLVIASVLYALALSRGLDGSRVSRVWSVFAVVSLVTIAVQWSLYLAVDRLPALAYADSISVRFGGVWDSPNGYAVVVAGLVPAVLAAGRRYRLLRLVVAAALLASLALSLSLTGTSSTILALLLGAVVLRWRSSLGGVLLIPAVLGLALYLAWPSVSETPYVAAVLESKSGSFQGHARSLEDLQRLGSAAVAGYSAGPGELGEAGYVWLFQTLGVPLTLVYVVLGVTAMRRLRHAIAVAPGPEGMAATYAFFFFIPSYLIGLLNLQLSAEFPLDLLYALGIVFAFCHRPVRPEANARSAGGRLGRLAAAPDRPAGRSRTGGFVESTQVLAALRAAWWWLALSAVIGGTAAFGLSRLQPPVYTSTTQFFLATTDSVAEPYDSDLFLERRAPSHAELLRGETLAGRVVDRLDLPMPADALARQIEVSTVPRTVLIDVVVTDTSPDRAAAIAEALGQEFTRMVASTERAVMTDAPRVVVQVTEPPAVPATPSGPPAERNAALGVLVGLLLGATAVFLRLAADPSVKDLDTAAELAGAPVVGTIPRDRALVSGYQPGSAGTSAEAFRQTRNNLQLLAGGGATLLVSGVRPSDGATTVALNLAVAIADAGRSVVVVATDPEESEPARSIGSEEGPGLTDVSAGPVHLAAFARHSPAGIAVLPAGQAPPGFGERLGPDRMASLVDRLARSHDVVLLDGPSVLGSADAGALAGVVDGVVLTVRHGRTREDQLERAAAVLHSAGARVAGIVLNAIPPGTDLARALAHDSTRLAGTRGRHSRPRRTPARRSRDA